MRSRRSRRSLKVSHTQTSKGRLTTSVYMYNFIHNTPPDFQVQAPEILNIGTLYLKRLTWLYTFLMSLHNCTQQ